MRSLMVLAIVLCVALPVFGSDDAEMLEKLEKEANNPAYSLEKLLEIVSPSLTPQEEEQFSKSYKSLQERIARAVKLAKSAQLEGDVPAYSLFLRRATIFYIERLSLETGILREARRRREERQRRKGRKIWDEFNRFPLLA